MPYGSVLIVDDVETNIFVAKGLMVPYELRIDSTDSGYGAIERIKNGSEYDIIFMDHMMPKLDGVETTKILRGMGYKKPVVALTANAVAGQVEIFLKNGFDDFISKPIDVRQLNAVLNKLIRDKQPPEILEAAAIRRGQDQASAPAALDPQFIEIILRDVDRSIAVFDAFIEKHRDNNSYNYSEDEIRMYVIHAHGMKSALANAEKMDLSAVAMKLEQLGRDKNIGAIIAETPAFIDSLRNFANEIRPQTPEQKNETEEDKIYLTEKLLEIKASCEEYDQDTGEKILKELRKKAWTKQTGELLEKIAGQLLHSDFDEISDAIDGWVK
jgi:CheY-like chemotaxis protein